MILNVFTWAQRYSHVWIASGGYTAFSPHFLPSAKMTFCTVFLSITDNGQLIHVNAQRRSLVFQWMKTDLKLMVPKKNLSNVQQTWRNARLFGICPRQNYFRLRGKEIIVQDVLKREAEACQSELPNAPAGLRRLVYYPLEHLRTAFNFPELSLLIQRAPVLQSGAMKQLFFSTASL